MTAHLTVLRSLGPVLAKTWRADGSIADYDNAARFRVRLTPYDTTSDLLQHLSRIADDPRTCVIRGAPAPDLDLTKPTERRIGQFVDTPSDLCMLDIDGYVPVDLDPIADPEAAVAQYIERELPGCFQGASCVWQLSGSMGHPSRPGVLRAHLWYLLAQPMTCAELEAWAMHYLPQCDHTVHRIVQVNYTAHPVLQGDQLDPLAGRRLGRLVGMVDDRVHVPETMPMPEGVRELRSDRRKMADPRLKPGVIGAVCSAFEPGRIVDLFPDLFAPGSKPERITWLAGGGTPEGVRVTDDALHLFNSHHTAPLQHAAHLFDFIAAHVFGHLDDDLDPDALALAPTQAPSYRATVAWALDQPEVIEALADANSEPAREAREAAQAAQAENALDDVAIAIEHGALEPSDAERRMAKFERLIRKANSLQFIETELAPKMRMARLSDSERAMLVGWCQLRARALKVTVPVARLRKWFDRPRAVGALPDMSPDGLPLMTTENVAAVLAAQQWSARYNVIGKRVEFIGDTLPVLGQDDDAVNNALTDVASACVRAGMSASFASLQTLALRVAHEHPYNPAADWIESAEWDGVDRLPALADTLVTRPEFETMHPGLKLLILRKWLLQAAALALSPHPIQARGVLVLAGPQYIGKSRWLQRLAPRGLVVAGRDLDPHNKDSVKLALSHWIAELGELGGTFKRADINALKAFLSNDVDALRLPYARGEVTWQRRTAFAASVNDEEFLVDDTGNTRFWPLPVLAVQPDHGVDMQQVFAQLAQCWRAGEPHYLTMPEMARVSEASAVHEREDPWAEQIVSTFAWPGGQVCPPPEHVVQGGGAPETVGTMGTMGTRVYWQRMSATDIAKRLGVREPTKTHTWAVGAALARLGALRVSSSHARRGWWVPCRGENFAEGTMDGDETA